MLACHCQNNVIRTGNLQIVIVKGRLPPALPGLPAGGRLLHAKTSIKRAKSASTNAYLYGTLFRVRVVPALSPEIIAVEGHFETGARIVPTDKGNWTLSCWMASRTTGKGRIWHTSE